MSRPPIHEVLAVNLRLTRERKHLSVAQLARLTEFEPDFIARVERGDAGAVLLLDIEKLAAALEVPVTDLLRRAGSGEA